MQRLRYILSTIILLTFLLQYGASDNITALKAAVLATASPAVSSDSSDFNNIEKGTGIPALPQNTGNQTTEAGNGQKGSGRTPNKAPQNLPENIVNPYVPYTYEQLLEDSDKLCRYFPDILSQEKLGKSLEGREIRLLKLGRGKRLITLNGSHHAREYISTTFLMEMIEIYARAYNANKAFEGYDVRKLLDSVTIYIVPMVNPDGVSIVQQGPGASGNPELVKKLNSGRTGYRSWKANARGVDLNYQYPYFWEKTKLHAPGPERYKGKSPATEPEVRLMMDFTLNNPFLLHVAYHTQGEVIYWYTDQKGELLKKSRELAVKLSGLTGYRLLSEGEQANSYSGYKDWTVSELKKPGFTIELCPYIGDIPYPDDRFDDIWNKAAATGLFFAAEALKLKGYDYGVYRDGKLLQLFNSEAEARSFAEKYGPVEIKYIPDRN